MQAPTVPRTPRCLPAAWVTCSASSHTKPGAASRKRSWTAVLGAVAGNGSSVVGSNAPQLAAKSHYSPSSQHIFGEMESSSSTSSLISPTLTYGTQTPSTLSPATPFFGSFNSQTEGFEKGGHGSGAEGQQKKQVNSGSGVGLSSLRS
ncbi:hypothetical protein BJ912DRAFT_29580 [Pholiota molesta]|nr:hypothetical protein BJ912DRAFT_29580 [Pholiota molesta]